MLDYKKFIKKRSVRLKILKLLAWVPDEAMVRLQYRIKTGRKLNLKDPKRFTEKLQWIKLYYRDPLMAQCVDKCDVREYVKAKGLESILVPCYGVYDSVEEIDWDALPDQFVAKDTLGGGGTSVIIVKDKKQEDLAAIRARMMRWTAVDSRKKGGGREWPYYNGKKHRIIIEQYLDPEKGREDPVNYKRFSADGRPIWIYIPAAGEKNASSLQAEKTLEAVLEDRQSLATLQEIAMRLTEENPHASVELLFGEGKLRIGAIAYESGEKNFQAAPGGLGEGTGVRAIHGEEQEKAAILARMTCKNPTSPGLIDYKYMCFHGEIAMIMVLADRKMGHSAGCGFFDTDLNKLPALELDETPLERTIEKPENFERMAEIAKILSADFPEARIDLYNLDGEIRFGEITFFDSSGYQLYNPDSFDEELGAKITLPEKKMAK